ncbi:kinase-like domain-containing protein [Xylariaceae sp. FL0016]|nr:kinase-like domain-containing protein [Xylariaceae sp. FL0016]
MSDDSLQRRWEEHRRRVTERHIAVPVKYRHDRRYNTMKFRRYRTSTLAWDPGRSSQQRAMRNLNLPRADNFVPDPMSVNQGRIWTKVRYDGDSTSRRNRKNLDSINYDRAYEAQKKQRNRVKRWMNTIPNVHYVKSVAFGGLGMVFLGRYYNQATGLERDFIVKVEQKNDDTEENPTGPDLWAQENRAEETNLRKFHRSEHIVQTLRRPDVSFPSRPLDLPRDYPASSDSTDRGDYEDDGSDTPTGPEPSKAPRADFSPAASRQRVKALRNRFRQRDRIWADYFNGVERPDEYKDYFLVEFLPNGSVDKVIQTMNRLEMRAPNRVLWSFWLCMVRGLAAMAYPVKTFHPNRRDPVPEGQPTYLREQMPAQNLRRYAQNWVHFDIDPRNILIGRPDRNDTEHCLIPKLKIGDFGLVTRIKHNKRDHYYHQRRATGKQGFFMPEQFYDYWDLFGMNPDSGDISNRRQNPETVAANYGPWSNIWGIANVMFSLITGAMPPQPPRPRKATLRYAPDGNQVEAVTYGRDLLSNSALYGYADRNLRETVVKCMNHFPHERPELHVLLEEAIREQRNNHGETDAQVIQWVQAMGLDVIPPREDTDPDTEAESGSGSDSGSGNDPDAEPDADADPSDNDDDSDYENDSDDDSDHESDGNGNGARGGRGRGGRGRGDRGRGGRGRGGRGRANRGRGGRGRGGRGRRSHGGNDTDDGARVCRRRQRAIHEVMGCEYSESSDARGDSSTCPIGNTRSVRADIDTWEWGVQHSRHDAQRLADLPRYFHRGFIAQESIGSKDTTGYDALATSLMAQLGTHATRSSVPSAAVTKATTDAELYEGDWAFFRRNAMRQWPALDAIETPRGGYGLLGAMLYSFGQSHDLSLELGILRGNGQRPLFVRTPPTQHTPVTIWIYVNEMPAKDDEEKGSKDFYGLAPLPERLGRQDMVAQMRACVAVGDFLELRTDEPGRVYKANEHSPAVDLFLGAQDSVFDGVLPDRMAWQLETMD